MRERLKRIVEDTTTSSGRLFDLMIQLLIVASLASFAIETLPGISDGFRRALRISEALIVGVFTVEYALRLVVADRPRRYATSFFGIIDLAAILPFYIATGIDLRSLRAFRLLRVFRIFKLARYNAAVRRFRIAFGLVREELVLFLSLSGVVLYLAAAGIYYFERQAQPEAFASILDGLWWALATLTTVGYGDVYPVTAGGRAFTALVLVVGLGVVAVPAGLVASALSEARQVVRDEDA